MASSLANSRMQSQGEKRHLLRWMDSSGTPVEELRAKWPLPAPVTAWRTPRGGWPYAQTPYSIVLDTAKGNDQSLVNFL